MNRIEAACQECGKRFVTASLLPVCTRCGSADIDVPDEVLLSVSKSLFREENSRESFRVQA